MNAYLLLFFAIMCEIIGTTALKMSHGFTRLVPTITLLVSYFLAFWMMSITLKTLPVSIVYAIWCGLGIMGIALIGIFYFKEPFGIWHLLGTLLIIGGVIILSAVTNVRG